MKKLPRLIAAATMGFVVIIAGATPQEVKHAPTVQQCQADQRLWTGKMETQPIPSGVEDVNYSTLVGWENEMAGCEAVDRPNEFMYQSALSEISTFQKVRLLGFLSRHNLLNKFYEEDEAGKR